MLSLFRTVTYASHRSPSQLRLPLKVVLARRMYSKDATSESTSEHSSKTNAESGSETKEASSNNATSTNPASAESIPETSATKEPEKSEWQLKFEAKDKDAAKFKEAWQRAKADFSNLQNITKQEVEKSKLFALQKFAKDLIESVDNFDLAMRAFPQEVAEKSPKEVQEFYKGITMVQQVLEKNLAKHGIVKVYPMGEKFDPNQHEALFQLDKEGEEPGTIIHVDRTGFKLHDRVLRAAKVGFVKDPNDN